MELLNKFNCLTFLGAARALKVSIWRIRYAVESGYLSAPSVVLKKRLLFSPDQVDEMRQFFEMEEAHKAAGVGNGGAGSPSCFPRKHGSGVNTDEGTTPDPRRQKQ